MSAKHTPGPWSIDRGLRTAIGHDAKHIAMVNFYNCSDPDRNVSGEEHDANARLIAAAPEMLKALTEAVDLIENHTMFDAAPLHALIDKINGSPASPISRSKELRR